MHIDSDFDSGCIVVHDASDPGAIELGLRGDTAADFRHWFHFHVHDAAGEDLVLRIRDAGASSYPEGWGEGYRACASYDGETWFRVPTDYDGEALTIQHTPEQDFIAYACFAPHPYSRHAELVEQAARSPRVRRARLGDSVEGRPVDLLVLGREDEGLPRVWIIARQHPGESMAGWFMEGLVERLLDEEDPLVTALLDEAALYLVPCMNPDGVALGNHRTNAAGRDLNREWLHPSDQSSPEVFHVLRAMREVGVDLFLDVHGDESLPYVFAVRAEGIPDYTERIQGLEELFVNHLADLDPDFQLEQGYELDDPGEADLRIAGNYVAQRFDCLSLTLEMPFIDNANRPDEEAGWSPERSRDFARSTMESVLACLTALR